MLLIDKETNTPQNIILNRLYKGDNSHMIMQG